MLINYFQKKKDKKRLTSSVKGKNTIAEGKGYFYMWKYVDCVPIANTHTHTYKSQKNNGHKPEICLEKKSGSVKGSFTIFLMDPSGNSSSLKSAFHNSC